MCAQGGGGATRKAGGRHDSANTAAVPGFMPESTKKVRQELHRMLRSSAAVLLKMKAEEGKYSAL